MIKELIKLANHLDQKGLTKEADMIDNIIRKSAGEFGRPTSSDAAEGIKMIMVSGDDMNKYAEGAEMLFNALVSATEGNRKISEELKSIAGPFEIGFPSKGDPTAHVFLLREGGFQMTLGRIIAGTLSNVCMFLNRASIGDAKRELLKLASICQVSADFAKGILEEGLEDSLSPEDAIKFDNGEFLPKIIQRMGM